MKKQLTIDITLVQKLITNQFPEWKDLSIWPVTRGGWDNRVFHLGEKMLVRMPSAAEYAIQVEKEHYWLPKLAPLLPLPIPKPLALGKPAEGYPWKWSIYLWLEGEAGGPLADLKSCASSLAEFLLALQRIDPTGGPAPGPHSFYRGGSLATYDAETRKAIAALKSKLDVDAAIRIWETALATSWHGPPVWVHGDISAGNLLIKNGKLCAVIDFGQLTVGDPACDLAIAWTLFKGASRKVFHTALPFDAKVWARARAWALWKALITAAGFTNPNNSESTRCWQIINEVLGE